METFFKQLLFFTVQICDFSVLCVLQWQIKDFPVGADTPAVEGGGRGKSHSYILSRLLDYHIKFILFFK